MSCVPGPSGKLSAQVVVASVAVHPLEVGVRSAVSFSTGALSECRVTATVMLWVAGETKRGARRRKTVRSAASG